MCKGVKANTEIICDVSLSKIKKEIKDCKKLINNYSTTIKINN